MNTSRARDRSRRAFTLIEAAAILVVCALVGTVLLIPLGQTRCGSRQLKDAAQVRWHSQGIAIWAGSNQNRFPLPSALDRDNATIATEASCKDTTANVLSVLLYNSHITTELCINPAEANAQVQQMPHYTFNAPPAAARPAEALWDPAFSADFTSPQGGNTSYATMAMTRERLGCFASLYGGTDFAIVGNRGPELLIRKRKAPEVDITLKDPASTTLLMHGARTTWEGNIAYADGHVNFETLLAPEAIEYKDGGGTAWRDALFFDERDDPSRLNAFLGIFVNRPGRVVPIFD